MWSGSTIPTYWVLCDGSNGTPDLRNKFILGATDTNFIGETGGNSSVTLSVQQIPAHNHNINIITQSQNQVIGSGFNQFQDPVALFNVTQEMPTSFEGSNQPINIMPPYYTLVFIMRLY
jgi:microcystin-dependent protein